MSVQTFLGMAQDLMLDADVKAAFEADPDGFLAARGFDGLSPDDLTDAVGFVAETVPPETARVLTDPDAGGDGLVRLAQVDPVAADDPDPGPGDDPGFGQPGLDDHAGDDADTDDEDEEDEEIDLGGSTDGADDPTQLPEDPTHSGFEPFRDDELDSGLGVGYGNEDVDDVSPPDHGAPPDIDLHL